MGHFTSWRHASLETCIVVGDCGNRANANNCSKQWFVRKVDKIMPAKLEPHTCQQVDKLMPAKLAPSSLDRVIS